MGLNLTDCFNLMSKYKVSDLHLKVGAPPLVRKNGQLMRLHKEQFSLTNEDILNSVDPFLNPLQKNRLKEQKQLDFSYGVKGVGRFRFNIFYQRGTLRLVARNIPFEIPTYESLNLPPALKNILKNPDQKGLILVTGATGSGKSSTIVAMLDDINQKLSRHIITIEDPIEFLIKDKKSLITQRELGADYINYNMALKSTLRQDPDIIFFGEIRDFESMETTLTAANTGHLVFSTLHTNNVMDTIHRVLGMVSPEKKGLFRMEFASSLKAIVCQKLIMKKDNSGLIPAVEILINNPRIRAFLEDEKRSTSNLYDVIEQSKEVWGMQSFNQHLVELVEKNLISKEQALNCSPSPEKLTLHFSGLSQKNTEEHTQAENKKNNFFQSHELKTTRSSIPLDIVKDNS
ncbi:MAG: PilT/PilU family type 4a pilus ATPase [Oligoflexia bacterium]|nr:PilT/PilU family type 4a pilus ATPase [Oligoflexia bacterium]